MGQDIHELLDRLDSTLNGYEKYIKDLNEKIESYKNICFWYSEEVYRFLGNFRTDNLDPKQLKALDILKEVINTKLEDNYKEYLESNYIRKDYYKSINDEELLSQIKEIQSDFYNDLNSNLEDLDE